MRLGVWREGALGDTLLLAPALRQAKRLLPGLDVTLWGRTETAFVLQMLGLADEIRERGKGFRCVPGYLDALAAFDNSPQSFELVVSAFDIQRSEIRPHLPGGIHRRTQYHWQVIADVLGLPPSRCDDRTTFAMPILSPSPAWLARYQGAVALHCGASTQRKVWGLAAIEALADRIESDMGLPVVFIEGPSEQYGLRRARPVLQLPFIGLAWALARMSGYIGHDTSVSHLAGMMGVPSLILFGPASDPDVWHPAGPRVRVIRDYREETPETVYQSFRQHLLGAREGAA